MVKGSRVMILTIDEGGIPPHIKPLIASIADAIGKDSWGEVTHSTYTAQETEELEESHEALAEALEASEEGVHEVRQAALDLVEEVEEFCKSTEVVAVSTALKKAYEAGIDPGRDEDYTTEPFEQTKLREQIKQAETDFVIAVEKLKTYALRKQTEL